MDEYEMLAFELSMTLENARRQYPRSEPYEDRLEKLIVKQRARSRTYRMPIKVRKQ